MIINAENYVKYNYFCDDDSIDNVMLQIWKFPDFHSLRQAVGTKGDDIMYRILVHWNVVVSEININSNDSIYDININRFDNYKQFVFN